MFRPVEAVSARANASPLAVQTDTHFPTQHRSQPPLAVNGQSASTPSSKSSASSTTQAPEGASARAGAAAATDAPAKAGAVAAPSAAAKPPVVIAAPIKKRAMKKPNVTWHYASRDEPLGLVPGEYGARRAIMRVGREADIIAMADTGRPLKLNLRSSQVAPFPIFVLRSRNSAAPGQQADAAAASLLHPGNP